MTNKVKITKQELKEDKFTTAMLKTRGWLEENWQIAAVVAAAIVIIIVGTVYYTSSQKSGAVEALEKYSQALNQLQTQNYQPAILAFNEIVDNYGGDVAGRAQFNLGNAYFESRNYDEAILSFQRYIDKFHLDPMTTSSAIAGIAACLESKQSLIEAGDKFAEALEYYPETPARADYLLGAVRCYSQIGEKDKLQPHLDELENDFSGSPQYLTAYQLYKQM